VFSVPFKPAFESRLDGTIGLCVAILPSEKTVIACLGERELSGAEHIRNNLSDPELVLILTNMGCQGRGAVGVQAVELQEKGTTGFSNFKHDKQAVMEGRRTAENDMYVLVLRAHKCAGSVGEQNKCKPGATALKHRGQALAVKHGGQLIFQTPTIASSVGQQKQ
jgi:hypothetical protein